MPTIPITSSNAGVRLDRLLRKRLAHMPLAEIYRLIRQGHACVNGRKVRQNYRLAEGDRIQIEVAEAEVTATGAAPSGEVQRIAATAFFKNHFRVLFEDECLVVCDKPCGVVVHPGTGHRDAGNLIDMARSYLLARGEKGEPDLVHRLDRDTSGVILIAKDKSIVRILHEDLRAGRFAKQYMAICHGTPRPLAGTICADLRYTFGGYDGTKVRVAKQGLASCTRYAVAASHGGISRVEVELDTGRTHQIRVHFAHIGCPLAGDARYGDEARDRALFGRTESVRRLYLHAWRVSFPHPRTRRSMTVVAPEPEEFRIIME